MEKQDSDVKDIINNFKIWETDINLEDNCDLILSKLNNILNKITDYYNTSSEEINNYISFLNDFSFQISQINNIYKESQKKISNNNLIYKDFEKFNNYNLIITEKFGDLSLQIQRSIISPFEIYVEKYKKENNTIINNFQKLIEKIQSENNYLYEIKKEYENDNKNYENEKNEENKINLKEKIEETIELYKLKINEINLSLLNFHNESNNILEEIINKQLAKNQSIKNSINNYFDIMDNFFSKSNESLISFKNRIDDINGSLNNSHFIKNIKLNFEEIKWEINTKNVENRNKKINYNYNYNKNLTFDKKLDYKLNDTPNDIIISKNSQGNLTDKKNKNYQESIKLFISNLFKKETLPENEAAEFLILLSDDINIELYTYLCNCFNRYQKDKNKSIKEFLNFNNFTHFSNILNLIIENLMNNNDPKLQFDKYILLDKIICIGEKAVCDNTFICSLLSNNKKLKNESLWNICITYKLISELKNICENYYSSNSKRKKIIGYGKHILSKISYIEKKLSNKDDFIVYKGYNKFIPRYNDLSSQIKENICKNELPKLMHNILKIYISHMANYNYPLEGNYKLIESIYFEYFNLKPPELMNFYINYSIASTFYIRRIIPIPKLKQQYKSEELKRKIKEIKKHNYLVENKNFFSLKNINNIYLILKNTIIFLENVDKIKLINLNKYLYELIRKDIYHNILLNLKNSSFSININEIINIWKCFLKCNSIYKKLGFENNTYELIIKNIFSNKDFFNNFKNEINIIELDIPRSPFKQDIESSSKAIKNILFAFLFINNQKTKKILYYQGMNYIVTFLYEMIHKEEDCLLLLCGLFYSTEYSQIFSADMAKMQKYLYVVERLVYLYLPKIYSHLRDNNLELNFFVNPIFISLFTNIYSSLPENDYSFLLEIWNDFILNGWKTIFTDVLAILKMNENKILNLNSEELMKYLSSGITNGEMFTIYNYDEFKKEKNKYQPTNQLLEILSKESILEEGLKN